LNRVPFYPLLKNAPHAGFAWHYTYYDHNPHWAGLQKEAASEKRGLWADQHPTPPWQWRKRKRK
jgi:endonuclease YncB( thermonuclease family)